MEPLNLPLLPTADDKMAIILLPGLDRSKLKKWDYEVDEENDIMEVQCYYGGFTESGNLDAITYPVKLDDEKLERIEKLERLFPMNPLEVNLEDYFDEQRADELRRFFKQLENKYGRDLNQ
ncbi:MAG: hypothetical protein ABEK50_12070 [bacterium]